MEYGNGTCCSRWMSVTCWLIGRSTHSTGVELGSCCPLGSKDTTGFAWILSTDIVSDDGMNFCMYYEHSILQFEMNGNDSFAPWIKRVMFTLREEKHSGISFHVMSTITV